MNEVSTPWIVGVQQELFANEILRLHGSSTSSLEEHPLPFALMAATLGASGPVTVRPLAVGLYTPAASAAARLSLHAERVAREGFVVCVRDESTSCDLALAFGLRVGDGIRALSLVSRRDDDPAPGWDLEKVLSRVVSLGARFDLAMRSNEPTGEALLPLVDSARIAELLNWR
jgi:hypothetical protein